MNDTTATARQELPTHTGFTPGAEEAQGVNRIFVNLRIGKIAQTSNTELPGFVPAKTKNKSGQENHFFAKPYDHITGYVTDIRWHTHTLDSGTVLTGWNITIDAGEKGIFVLGVSSKDRPYQRLMSTLIAVDFEKPVRFIGFMGTNQATNQPQKVLLLTQEMGADNKPIWLQPATQEKWLSRSIINKLKEGIELTEGEERNVSRDKDGKFNKDYPYIVENVDGTWSFDQWNNFLHEQVNEFVIPNVKAANELRGAIAHDRPAEVSPSLPADVVASGPASGPAPLGDDDIPF